MMPPSGSQLHIAGTKGSQRVNRTSFLKIATKATLKVAVATAPAPSGAFPSYARLRPLQMTQLPNMQKPKQAGHFVSPVLYRAGSSEEFSLCASSLLLLLAETKDLKRVSDGRLTNS